MNEEWRPIVGYEGRYEVSNIGRVVSLINRRHELKQGNNKGYMSVVLSDGVTHKSKSVHQLVARAFIENPKGYKEVNHIDENKANNKVSNLEWCTRNENLMHGTAPKRRAATKSIPVVQYLDGIEIARFKSIKDADKAIGTTYQVCRCCKNKNRSIHGYKFRYLDDIKSVS